MKKKKPWLFYSFIALIILLGIYFLLHIGIQNIPTMDDQIPPGSTALQIQLIHPANQTGWPVNYPIPVQVSAWGDQPITAVELYINGKLYNSRTVQENKAYQPVTGDWRWQPGSQGTFVLTARAIGQNGTAGISNAVVIQASSPVGTGSPYQITDEASLENIAGNLNISLQDLQNANPGLDPDQPLEPGEEILVPNPPEPVNDTIIPALNPQGEAVSYPDPNPQGNGNNENTPKWSVLNDLSFLIKSAIKKSSTSSEASDGNNPQAPQTGGEDGKLPAAPELFGSFDGCDVKLNAQPLFDPYEDGYFIYRSQDGGAFERITTLPPYTNSYNTLNYTDENQYGLVTYYAASFNTYGENPGPPISFPLDQMNCSGGNGLGIQTNHIEENGDLTLLANLDTAYLYIQINDGQAERVPEGDRMFLANSGIKFNLYEYLDTREDLMELTDFSLHAEIWGWQGGALVYVGTLDQQIHRSILQVCSDEGEGSCTGGGLGHWTQEMTILPNIYKPLNEQKYELRWLSSSLSETNKICMSIAEAFNGPGLLDANPVLLNICYGASDNEGNYLLDFGKILYYQGSPQYPPYKGYAADFQYPDFAVNHPMGDPFELAVRVLPVMKTSGFNDISNTVYMHHLSPFEQTNLPPLASTIPSLYDIQILEDSYKPPEYEVYNRWGCVIVDSDPSGKYDSGQEVCPLDYVECGKNVECEDPGFWGMLGIGWDLVADTFNGAKEAVAGTIAKTIPLCDQYTVCQDAVRAGVDYGVTALTGLPPNLPNTDELVAQGITEAVVGELAYVSDPDTIEFICGDACKTEIEAQIKSYLVENKSYYSQPGCFSPGEHYGEFPVCFTPPTVVHPVLGAYNFPGAVVVRITRKNTPESINAGNEIKNKIQLVLKTDGENSNRIGQYGTYCSYKDNLTVNQLPDPSKPNSNANWGYFYLGDQPMQDALFRTVQVEIPWIEPGSSVDIPVRLEVFHNIADEYCITTAMSQYLFYKGTSHMEATEYCYSEDSSQLWVPCSEGGKDIWDFNNPPEPGSTDTNVIYGQVVDPGEGN